jgi:hypothetical protein
MCDGDTAARRRHHRVARAKQRKADAELRQRSTNLHQRWTTDENSIALRADLTHKQVATLVGRTGAAVSNQRRALARRLGLAETIRGFAAFKRKHFATESVAGLVTDAAHLSADGGRA